MLLVSSSCWGRRAPWTSAGGECVERAGRPVGEGKAGKERRGQGLGQTGPGQGRCLGFTLHLTDPPSLWPTLTKSQYQKDEKQSQEVLGVHGVGGRPGTLRRVWSRAAGGVYSWGPSPRRRRLVSPSPTASPKSGSSWVALGLSNIL